MKIIKHRPGRRPEYWAGATERPPQKKALLVGIQYERDVDGEGDAANVLRGPHRDVTDMRDLLIEYYLYPPQNIVVLVDTDDPNQMQPTRDNLIRAIQNLVQDAQAGDHFFFHYAGHTVQIENRNFSEEDGLDECIVPSDGEARAIKDNELRRYLVDMLPIGSNLVAIFDSCHSASLLDLDHFRCNRPWVPWISKGKRMSDSQWNAVVRRRALVLSRHVYQTKRLSSSSVKSRRTSIDQMLISSPDYKKLSIRTKSLTLQSELETWLDSPSSPILRCDSPESLWPCTGFCPPETLKEANVIALSACKDYQLSWEDSDGASMTTALIDILRTDPHPNLMNMMTNISHQLHGFYLRLHSHAQSYHKKVKELNKKRIARGMAPLRVPSGRVEMTNFQDPQMSSHRPIPRDAVWDP